MARLKLKQILSNISYNANTNELSVSGSLSAVQDNPTKTALNVSGSFFIVNAPSVASASLNTSGSINVDIIDAGSY
jgi:hypothetical protein